MDQVAKVDEYKAMAAQMIDLGLEYGMPFLTAILILIIGFVVAGWASRLIRTRLEKMKRFDKTLIPIVSEIDDFVAAVTQGRPPSVGAAASLHPGVCIRRSALVSAAASLLVRLCCTVAT